MVKQQIQLFPTDIPEKEGRRRKKQRKAALVYASVPVDEEVALLKDLVERLKMCCLDNTVLASEYVSETHWSKYLKRVNKNMEWHDLPKILLKNDEFIFMKENKSIPPVMVRLIKVLEEGQMLNLPTGKVQEILLDMRETKGRPQTEES